MKSASSAVVIVLFFIVSTAVTAQVGVCPPPPTTVSVTPGGTASPAPYFGPAGATGGATPTPAASPTGAGPVRPGTAPGATPAAGGYGAPSSAGRKTTSSMEAAVDWEWWWLYNGARFLNLKSEIREQRSRTGTTGEVSAEERAARVASYAGEVRGRIAALLETACDDTGSRVRAETALALGRCGLAKEAAEIEKLLADRDLEVRESAVLALGILGNEKSVPKLVEIFDNAPAGKKLIGRDSDIATSTRFAAAVALGLAAKRAAKDDDTAMNALTDVLQKKVADQDIHTAAVVGLGIMQRTEAVPTLLAVAQDDERNEHVRAFALTAIGKIGDRSAVTRVAKALHTKSEHVRRSAATALGLLVTSADEATVDLLIGTATMDADRATKNFAIMTLGRIGGPKATTALEKLVASDDNYDVTHGALALGLALRNADSAARTKAGMLLHDRFKELTTCRVRGALAIGMGLAGYDGAAKELIAVVESNAHAHLRGECAQALGLLREKSAIPALRQAVKTAQDAPFRTNSAVALGLIGDDEAVAVLKELTQESGGNIALSGAIMRGLGLIGDASGMKNLAEMLTPKESRDAVRAYAAEALGLLGDRDDLPVLAEIAEGENYVSQHGSLMTILNRLL